MVAGDRLQDKLRVLREDMDADHATRMHRAVSWLRCAEKYGDDDEDLSFVALWISFNACYAVNDERLDQRFWSEFRRFVE